MASPTKNCHDRKPATQSIQNEDLSKDQGRKDLDDRVRRDRRVDDGIHVEDPLESHDNQGHGLRKYTRWMPWRWRNGAIACEYE